jgi:hypothetical protein
VNWLQVVLRLVHVTSGALWVGMMVFTVAFLAPALQEVGPDAGKVNAALQKRRVMVIMPIIALLTLISGFWLFSRFSGGAPGAMMRTPVGLAFGLGGLAALLGFVVGIALMRPVMMRSLAIAKEMGAPLPEAERRARIAELERLRARGAAVSRIVTGLLLFALGAMAVARYL